MIAEFIVFLCAAPFFVYAAFAFRREMSKDVYRELIRRCSDGEKPSLYPLSNAYKRAFDDPLRPAHVKLAKLQKQMFITLIFRELVSSLILTPLIYWIRS